MQSITTNSRATVMVESTESALRLLNNAVAGKSLSYDAPFYCEEGKDPCDGLSLRLADYPEEADDTEIQILPILTAEGKPVLSIYCHPCGKPDSLANEEIIPADTVRHPTALERRELYKTISPKKSDLGLSDRITATKEWVNAMSKKQLEEFGHDTFNGKKQMNTALDTIAQLAEYDQSTALKAYLDFMETNLSGSCIYVQNAPQQ